jgi:hypothetical protein
VSLDLSSVRAKIDRAAEHLKTIDGLIGPEVETEMNLRSEVDLVKQGHWLIHEDAGGAKDEILGPILGDYLHNTRSALDHLICAVVRSNRVAVRKYHTYPFCLTPQEFRENIVERDSVNGPSCLDGMTPDQIQVVSLHQPYVGRDKRRAARSPLFSLHKAWNVDKHRAINTTRMSVVATPTVDVEPKPLFTIRAVEPQITTRTPLKPETKIAFVRVGVLRGATVPEGVKPKVEAHLLGSIEFRGEGGLRFSYKDLRQMLRDATWAIRGFDHTFKAPW